MTIAPATLTALGRYWTAQGGRNLGIVGDTRHAVTGTSYHLGRSQLAANAYSRATARDRAGLTEAASAIDLGKLGGSLGQLRAFSHWFVERCRTNAPGTSDVREFIYSPDGTTVLRWDRERGVASAPQPGEADDSHRGHSHISFYRDSERRSKIGLFVPYFVPVTLPDPGTGSTEERVIVVMVEKFPSRPFTSTAAKLRRFTATAELGPIDGPYAAEVDATVEIESAGVPHGAGFLRLASGGSAGCYILASQVTLS